MGPDCIDHRGLLADEPMAGAVEHQAALVLGSLGWYKPRVGPGDCLANGLRVSRIILLPLDVGSHRPVVSAAHCGRVPAARVTSGAPRRRRDADKAWWHLLEERQDVAALQLAANDRLAVGINPMNLKNRLGDV